MQVEKLQGVLDKILLVATRRMLLITASILLAVLLGLAVGYLYPSYLKMRSLDENISHALLVRNESLVLSALERSVDDGQRMVQGAKLSLEPIIQELLGANNNSSNSSNPPEDKDYMQGGRYASMLLGNPKYDTPVTFELPQTVIKSEYDKKYFSKTWRNFLSIASKQLTQNASIKWIYVGTSSGSFMVFPSSPAIPSDYDPRTRPWFQAALQHPDKEVWSNPYFTAGGDDMVLTVAKSMKRPTDNSCDVVGIDIPVGRIVERMLLVTQCSNCFVAMLDSAGHVLATKESKDKTGTWKQLPVEQQMVDDLFIGMLNQDDRDRVRKFVANETLLHNSIKRDTSLEAKKTVIGSYSLYIASIQGLNWTILGTVPVGDYGDDGKVIVDQTRSGFRSIFSMAILFYCLSISCITALIYFGFKVIRRYVKTSLKEPLNQLTSLAEEIDCLRLEYISKGSEISLNESKTYEYGIIGKSVNELLATIKEYQNELTKNETLAALGQSTAMVAHDVRKPLASMKALLTALPSIKDDPNELKKIVTTVDRNISQTNAMLNDILEFSRDSTSLDLKENNSSGLITSALGDALRNHPGSNVRIEYNLKHLYALKSDVVRITRVLTNIIDNALDAMTSPQSGKASGALCFETDELKHDGAEFGVIVVSDNGPGIPAEALDRIFDPFFTLGKKGGTGLGLAICHRVISLHGGKIRADNREDGKGARFTIELPLGKDRVGCNESELIRHSSELEQFRIEEAGRVDYGDTANTSEFLRINKERGRKSYLLILDDEPLFRESIRAILNEITQVRDHVKVVEAESAETAFRIFDAREFDTSTAPNPPLQGRVEAPLSINTEHTAGFSPRSRGIDYVIADIDLGRGQMNGYDFAQIVLKKYPNTRVLIHSNKRKGEMDRNIRSTASDKFMGFLPKPMRSSELLQFLACKTFETPSNHRTIEPSNKKNVLVVNDDDSLIVAFKIQLRSPDVQVLSAGNVSDALKRITEQKVDVILSDINLGSDEPSGYDLLKKVREKDKSVPFYMVSGYSEADEGPKARDLGATGYLQLPVEGSQLKRTILPTSS